MLRITHGQPLQLAGVSRKIIESLNDMDIRRTCYADRTSANVLSFHHIIFRSFITVTVNIHHFQNRNLLIRCIEQRIKLCITVCANAGRCQNLVSDPGSHVGIFFSSQPADRLEQIVLSVIFDCADLIDCFKQVFREHEVFCIVFVYHINHELVAENSDFIRRHLHSRISRTTVNFKDPCFLLIGKEQNIALFRAIFVQQ